MGAWLCFIYSCKVIAALPLWEGALSDIPTWLKPADRRFLHLTHLLLHTAAVQRDSQQTSEVSSLLVKPGWPTGLPVRPGGRATSPFLISYSQVGLKIKTRVLRGGTTQYLRLASDEQSQENLKKTPPPHTAVWRNQGSLRPFLKWKLTEEL